MAKKLVRRGGGKKLKKDVEKNVRDFKSIFSEFGEAVVSVVKDSKLRRETQKIGESFAGAGRALVERLRDKEVKKEFKDVRKAAKKFGRDAAKKAVKKAAKTIKKTVKKIEKKVAKKK